MYPKTLIQLALLLILLADAKLHMQAQDIRLPYRHFTVHDGLPQQQVMCLLQDSRGYIWVGTKAGISQYNGENFKNFPNDTLASGHIIQILEDEEGDIWVHTESGVGYFDGVKWKKLVDFEVAYLFEIDSRMYGYEEETKKLWNFRKEGAVVVKTLDNFDLIKNQKESIVTVIRNEELSENVSVCFGLNQKLDVVYLDTIRNERFSHINDTQTKRWTSYSTFSKDNWVRLFNFGDSKPYDSVWVEAGLGKNYAQSYVYTDGSLLVLSHKQFYYRPVGQKKASQILLPISSAVHTIKDAEGAIWIGSEAGLFQYFPNGLSFISENDAPIPWSVFEDSKERYWISSYGNGLRQVDGGNLKRISITPEFYRLEKDIDYFYFGISEDHLGNLYFSSQGGLLKLSNGKWSNILIDKEPEQNSLGLIVLYNLFDPIRKKVLAAMYEGVYVYDPENDRLDSILLPDIQNYINGIAVDQKDNWWFSSELGGIARYHIPSGNITYFHKGKNGVPLSGALNIETEPRGGLWFGGVEGLFYFDEKNNSFRKVAASILRKTVYSLKVVDSLLLIGEGSGLFVLHRYQYLDSSVLNMKAYNQHNGFFGIGPKQNASMIDSKGNFWIVCSNQISFIHKSKIDLINHPTKVRIFQINKENVPFSGSGEITLPSGENKVTIRFESIGFQRPLKTQYSWRLPGYLDTWSEWSEDHAAFLSLLPSGQYTFEVRSRHPGTEDSTAYISDKYDFQVSLPFFKEPDFYKYSFLGFGLVAILSSLMIWYIRKARKETHEAQQMAKDRERLIKYYQVQTLQAQLNPHFIFNLLETIQQYVEQQKRPEAVEQIQRLAKLLRRFLDSSINSDLEHIGEGNNEISLSMEVELLRYYIELEQIQKPGMFEFDINVAAPLQPANLFVSPMIIQPFVENAIKRGLVPKENPPRNLWVNFKSQGEGIRCVVEDNGIGMEASRELLAKSDRKFKPRGVALVRERAALLKDLGVIIDIDMKDRPNGGTIVTIDFASNPVG